MSVINTNVKALVAQESMRSSNLSMSQAMERLSTGSKINSAKDDAAGLAITNRMTSQIRGMAKAIEKGLPKLRIEEAAARKQARIDSGREKIVGVNIFQTTETSQIDILEVDNTAVRESQVQRLNELKANRDQAAVDAALEAL